MYTLGDLAQRLDLSFRGEADRPLSALATLAEAGPEELAFLANKKYLPQLAATRAGAVILQPDLVDQCPTDCLVSDDPYVVFARLTHLFNNAPRPTPGVHPSAVVAQNATITAGASVAANAVIEAGAWIGEGALVGANAYIGNDCRVGAHSRVMPNAVLYHDVQLGEACTIHSQAVLGADGFGFAPGPEGWEKICQLGGVRVGDRVEIGAGTTIDRGALGHTVIEDDVIIDDQVHIAHNCRIGKNTAIAGCTGLAGSSIIGANCTLAGAVGVAGHLEICDGVHITGMSIVTKSITEPGSYSSGTPTMPTRDWRRSAVRFSQLDAIAHRLAALEKQK